MLRTHPQDEQPSTDQSPGGDVARAGHSRDPEHSAEAPSAIEEHLRRSTRRLADLNVVIAASAAERPGTDVLETQFYFARPVVRSAVVHRCASEGGRQYAMAWLFERVVPDLNVHLPAGEVTVTADGKAYVSAGCPTSYPFRPQASPDNDPKPRTAAVAPATPVRTHPVAGPATSVPRRAHARLLWVPLLLLVIAAGGVLVYRNLIAPELAASEIAAVPAEGEPPTVIAAEEENPAEPEPQANAPESASLSPAEEPVLYAEDVAASDDEFPLPAGGAASSAQQPATAERSVPASRPTLSQGRTAAAERPSTRRRDAGSPLPRRSSEPAPRVQAPANRPATIAAAPPANLPSPAPADPPIAIGGTPGSGVETTQPVAKEQPPAPVVVRDAQPAPAPAAQKRKQQVAVENTWLRRMRAELNACGRSGLLRNDICREVTRWRHCHPDRWNTVAECRVESFAEPLS